MHHIGVCFSEDVISDGIVFVAVQAAIPFPNRPGLSFSGASAHVGDARCEMRDAVEGPR